MAELKPIPLVEDSPKDVELTLAALAQSQLANEVVVAHDGAGALDYLLSHGAYGTVLIRQSVTHELDGTVDLTFGSPGLACAISFPLPPDAPERRGADGARSGNGPAASPPTRDGASGPALPVPPPGQEGAAVPAPLG